MSEKKRFRLGPAVVNLCMMKPDLAETVVNLADSCLKCVHPSARAAPLAKVGALAPSRDTNEKVTAHQLTNQPPAPRSCRPPCRRFLLVCRENMTEQEVAADLRKRLTAKMPDNIWQVRPPPCAARTPTQRALLRAHAAPLACTTHAAAASARPRRRGPSEGLRSRSPL